MVHKSTSAFAKWLGHPLVHILLKCKPHGNSHDALRTPVDFWLEDETVHKTRSRGLGVAMLIIIVANRQGVVKFCGSEALDAMQALVAPLEGIEMARPNVETFPIGSATMRSYARHRPRSRIPGAFPANAMNASDMGECENRCRRHRIARIIPANRAL